jgi:hypothetical protein
LGFFKFLIFLKIIQTFLFEKTKQLKITENPKKTKKTKKPQKTKKTKKTKRKNRKKLKNQKKTWIFSNPETGGPGDGPGGQTGRRGRPDGRIRGSAGPPEGLRDSEEGPGHPAHPGVLQQPARGGGGRLQPAPGGSHPGEVQGRGDRLEEFFTPSIPSSQCCGFLISLFLI